MKTVLKKCLFLYIVLMIAFVLFNYIAAALPKTDHFQKMVEKSSGFLMAGNEYYNLGPSVMDNFSDAIIVSTAYCLKSGCPFQSSMLMVHYDNGDWSHKVGSLDQLLKNGTQGMIREPYWRYWHGQSSMLSFLFYFTDLSYIYPLIGAVTLFLVMAAGTLVYKKYGMIPALSLFFLVSLCNFQVFFQSLQFYPVFWIGFGGLLFFLLHTSCSKEPLFFALGMLCAFFDLLTVPIATFCIPALIICLEEMHVNMKNGTVPWKKWCRIWLFPPVIWGIGYGLSWGAKMICGLLLTGNYRVLLDTALLRFGAQVSPEQKISRCDTLIKNVTTLVKSEPIVFLLFLAVLLSVFIGQILLLRKRKTVFCSQIFWGYCIMACFPIAVMLVLANHAYLHAWFTYRGISICAASLLMTLTAFHPVQGKQEQPLAEAEQPGEVSASDKRKI